MMLYLVASIATIVSAQEKPPKTPPAKPYPQPAPGATMPGFFNGHRDTTERKMAVDSNVAIKLCVSEGELKINGWARDEVRIEKCALYPSKAIVTVR